MADEMVKKKTWQEFRDTGLFWFVNTTLHMFGWALVYDTETKTTYPARVKFRGFDEEITTEGYEKVSKYMKENANVLHEESKE